MIKKFIMLMWSYYIVISCAEYIEMVTKQIEMLGNTCRKTVLLQGVAIRFFSQMHFHNNFTTHTYTRSAFEGINCNTKLTSRKPYNAVLSNSKTLAFLNLSSLNTIGWAAFQLSFHPKDQTSPDVQFAPLILMYGQTLLLVTTLLSMHV